MADAKTVRIFIKFFTTLREVVGKKEEALTFRDKELMTVDSVLKRLSNRYGKSFCEYIYDDKGKVRSFLQFFVNGRSTGEDGLNTKLTNGDVLAIIPPVGGG